MRKPSNKRLTFQMLEPRWMFAGVDDLEPAARVVQIDDESTGDIGYRLALESEAPLPHGRRSSETQFSVRGAGGYTTITVRLDAGESSTVLSVEDASSDNSLKVSSFLYQVGGRRVSQTADIDAGRVEYSSTAILGLQAGSGEAVGYDPILRNAEPGSNDALAPISPPLAQDVVFTPPDRESTVVEAPVRVDFGRTVAEEAVSAGNEASVGNAARHPYSQIDFRDVAPLDDQPNGANAIAEGRMPGFRYSRQTSDSVWTVREESEWATRSLDADGAVKEYQAIVDSLLAEDTMLAEDAVDNSNARSFDVSFDAKSRSFVEPRVQLGDRTWRSGLGYSSWDGRSALVGTAPTQGQASAPRSGETIAAAVLPIPSTIPTGDGESVPADGPRSRGYARVVAVVAGLGALLKLVTRRPTNSEC